MAHRRRVSSRPQNTSSRGRFPRQSQVFGFVIGWVGSRWAAKVSFCSNSRNDESSISTSLLRVKATHRRC